MKLKLSRSGDWDFKAMLAIGLTVILLSSADSAISKGASAEVKGSW